MKQKTLYVGHRGTKLLNGVENTKEAFIEAASLGYDVIETDVRVTLDGEYICFHDDNLTRLTLNSKIKYNDIVTNMHYKDLKDIILTQNTPDGKKRMGKICLFDEYLDICKKYQKTPIIELKWTNGIYASLDDKGIYNYSNLDGLVEKIFERNMENDCIIMTSMIGCLEYIKAHYPNIKLQWLCHMRTHEFLEHCVNQGFDIDVNYNFCDEALVNYCHENNRLVNIWTLNDEDLLDKYLEIGVDMITTDYIRPRK